MFIFTLLDHKNSRPVAIAADAKCLEKQLPSMALSYRDSIMDIESYFLRATARAIPDKNSVPHVEPLELYPSVARCRMLNLFSTLNS